MSIEFNEKINLISDQNNMEKELESVNCEKKFIFDNLLKLESEKLELNTQLNFFKNHFNFLLEERTRLSDNLKKQIKEKSVDINRYRDLDLIFESEFENNISANYLSDQHLFKEDDKVDSLIFNKNNKNKAESQILVENIYEDDILKLKNEKSYSTMRFTNSKRKNTDNTTKLVKNLRVNRLNNK